VNRPVIGGVPAAVIYGAAVLLAAAVLPLPYGYYQLLRLVGTGVFAWGAFVAFQRGSAGYAFGFAVLALLFNPVVPVYLSKAAWMPIDVGAALALVLSRRVIGAGIGAAPSGR
jgi:hypothetical protein